MIIVVGAEKGGTGKSSVSQNLAYRMQVGNKGQPMTVQLVDTDTTSTTSHWVDRRNDQEIKPEIELMRALNDPSPAIIDSSDKFNAVIADVGARSYKQFQSLARIADLWIAPVQVGVGDLDSALSLYEALRAVDKQHKSGRIPLAFVFTRVPTNSVNQEVADAREFLLAEQPDMPIMQACLHERKVWRDAQRVGRSIFEMPKRDGEKACKDFNMFLVEALRFASKKGV
jgi:chromosome partitioning protein